jgi:hypothetical protein
MRLLPVVSALLIGASTTALHAQAVQLDSFVLVESFDTRRPFDSDATEHGVILSMAVIFHDGSFDLYDISDFADAALSEFANEGRVGLLRARLEQEDPEARLVPLFNFAQSSGQAWHSNVYLDPDIQTSPLIDRTHHRYLSYIARIYPSDDAFIANDNPRQYPLFDENENFIGPHVIEVMGDEVLDAGTRLNDEANVALLDIDPDDFDPAAGVPTQEPITKHPGFNGSFRNPDGSPARILGAQFVWPRPPPRDPVIYRYSPELADFTLPGAKLFRLRVTSGFHEGFSGYWHMPQRSGEGFQLSVFHQNGVPQLGVTWYTFRPDGSGRQVFLFGYGPSLLNGAWIDLVETENGRFASPETKETLVVKPWGRIRIRFETPQCLSAVVDRIEPIDPAWAIPQPELGYVLSRTTPLNDNAAKLCGGNMVPFNMF